jgi:hypothetical protein
MTSINDLDSHVHDNLIAGSAPILSKSVVIDTGALTRGTVLGKIKVGAVPSSGTAGGGNVGSGTMTLVAAKRRIQPGTYTATCVNPGSPEDGGAFEVKNPKGEVIGVASADLPHVNNEIGFSINDISEGGGADFQVGDVFTIAVPAASAEKYVKVDKTAIDGSGVADSILSEDADASSADVTSVAYTTGIFNSDALVVAAGDTVADHVDDLRVNDIHLKSNVVPE